MMTMPFTYHTLIEESAAADAALSAYADLFCRVERILFSHQAAEIAAGRDPDELDLKHEFQETYKISSRQFNAIEAQLGGKTSAVKESRKELIQAQKTRIKKAEKVIKDLSKPPKRVKGRPAETDAERKARDSKRAQKERRLAALRKDLAAMEADHEKGIIRIAFGSKQLFHKQFNWRENGYKSYKEGLPAWREEWRAARSSQFLVMGSRDERAGCLGCQAMEQPDQSFDLKIRLPDALVPKEPTDEQMYIHLKGLKFAHGYENISRALAESRPFVSGPGTGHALSWRFVREMRDGKPRWYAHVTMSVPAPKIITFRDIGAIGADFNADHVAVAELDRCFNPIGYKRIDTHLEYRTSGQRDAILGDAIKQLVEMAVQARKPIVVEELDFRQKKSQLEGVSPRHARMLSSLAYSKFHKMLRAACFRAGVEVIEINPAHTSVIGTVNHAQDRAISGHLGAAAAIGRRGLERRDQAEAPRASVMRNGALIPLRNGGYINLMLPVSRNRRRHVWSYWTQVGRKLRAALKAHYQSDAWNRRRAPSPLSPPRARAVAPDTELTW